MAPFIVYLLPRQQVLAEGNDVIKENQLVQKFDFDRD